MNGSSELRFGCWVFSLIVSTRASLVTEISNIFYIFLAFLVKSVKKGVGYDFIATEELIRKVAKSSREFGLVNDW